MSRPITVRVVLTFEVPRVDEARRLHDALKRSARRVLGPSRLTSSSVHVNAALGDVDADEHE